MGILLSAKWIKFTFLHLSALSYVSFKPRSGIWNILFHRRFQNDMYGKIIACRVANKLHKIIQILKNEHKILKKIFVLYAKDYYVLLFLIPSCDTFLAYSITDRYTGINLQSK